MSYTIIIIVITVLVSLAAFSNEQLMNRLILWPRKMDNLAEYYRLLSSGFIHADWMHLFFNMYTLYAFGATVQYVIMAHGYSEIMFVVLYLSGIVVASLPSFLKNRQNNHYRSLGASGGVSSIIFFAIYYFPWARISIVLLPIGIYSIVFGGLFLAYEAYMSKRGAGNVNHDAHFWGAVFGLLFAAALDPSHGREFIDNITHPH